MAANRANNNKKQRYQQPNPLTKHRSQSESLNEIIQHREDEQLLPKNSAENVDDDHPVHQKAIALPRVSYIIFLSYIGNSHTSYFYTLLFFLFKDVLES